jgi:hypothetical protein
MYSIAEAEALGYKSLDNAENYVEQFEGLPETTGVAAEHVGGPFCTVPLGEFNPI